MLPSVIAFWIKFKNTSSKVKLCFGYTVGQISVCNHSAVFPCKMIFRVGPYLCLTPAKFLCWVVLNVFQYFSPITPKNVVVCVKAKGMRCQVKCSVRKFIDSTKRMYIAGNFFICEAIINLFKNCRKKVNSHLWQFTWKLSNFWQWTCAGLSYALEHYFFSLTFIGVSDADNWNGIVHGKFLNIAPIFAVSVHLLGADTKHNWNIYARNQESSTKRIICRSWQWHLWLTARKEQLHSNVYFDEYISNYWLRRRFKLKQKNRKCVNKIGSFVAKKILQNERLPIILIGKRTFACWVSGLSLRFRGMRASKKKINGPPKVQLPNINL